MGTDQQAAKVTERLAAFIDGLTFDALPAAVVERSKASILDTIGLAIAGAHHDASHRVRRAMQPVGGPPQASLLGRGEKTDALTATLCNAYACHVLDFDDTHYDLILHGNTPVVPPVLALAEWLGRSGRDVITAYVAGYETAARIGRAAWPDHHSQGWHVTGTLGTFGAAAAAAKLLGLGGDQLLYALGTAGAQAAGLQANRGTMAKSLNAAKAAMNGLLGALLAQQGFTTTKEILEHPTGFLAVYNDVFDPGLIPLDTANWEVLQCGFKPYPCGVVVHPVIDAALALWAQGVRLTGPERVEFHVNGYVERLTGVREPATGLQSKFSAVHSAAVALTRGTVTVDDYTDARATDPAIGAARRQVSIVVDESLARTECRAKAYLPGGEVREVHVTAAKGTRGNPMTFADVCRKFRDLVTPHKGAATAERLISLVSRLDELDDLEPLVSLAR